jgi:hypothetical protein
MWYSVVSQKQNNVSEVHIASIIRMVHFFLSLHSCLSTIKVKKTVQQTVNILGNVHIIGLYSTGGNNDLQ